MTYGGLDSAQTMMAIDTPPAVPRLRPTNPGGASWLASTTLSIHTRTSLAFQPTSKRRRGFPSETRVKRGVRVVHGDKELLEKLGRNDPCPCGSNRCF